MPILPEPQPSNSAGTPAQTSGASSRTRDEILARIRARYLELFASQDYGAIEQRVVSMSLQQEMQRLAITPLRDRYMYRGTSTGRMYTHQQEVLRCLLEQNPPRRNPWPFETWANTQHIHEDFIMANHDDNFIVNRITHTDLEMHITHLLAHYSEGTAEGDDIKARFEVQSSLSMRDEETAAKFQERCAFLAACYASKSFPPHRDTLKLHVLGMLTAATRDVLGAYGVYAASANGNGYSVLNTGRSSVFRTLEIAVHKRVETTPDAVPGSLSFYRDTPPSDWLEAEKTVGFVHDKQAHADELKREMALVETLAVGEDIKQLMRMYLTRAGNNYANALRYYHTTGVINLFRKFADNYTALLFYSYKVKDKEVRGLQYSNIDNDFITGFGGY